MDKLPNINWLAGFLRINSITSEKYGVITSSKDLANHICFTNRDCICNHLHDNSNNNSVDEL